MFSLSKAKKHISLYLNFSKSIQEEQGLSMITKILCKMITKFGDQLSE